MLCSSTFLVPGVESVVGDSRDVNTSLMEAALSEETKARVLEQLKSLDHAHAHVIRFCADTPYESIQMHEYAESVCGSVGFKWFATERKAVATDGTWISLAILTSVNT